MEVLDFERQGGISGWRHVRKAARGIKEDNPAAFFYVQDERYAAGAGMRRSGLFQFCTTSTESNSLRAVRFRAAHPCALSRYTVRPEHKRSSFREVPIGETPLLRIPAPAAYRSS